MCDVVRASCQGECLCRVIEDSKRDRRARLRWLSGDTLVVERSAEVTEGDPTPPPAAPEPAVFQADLVKALSADAARSILHPLAVRVAAPHCPPSGCHATPPHPTAATLLRIPAGPRRCGWRGHGEYACCKAARGGHGRGDYGASRGRAGGGLGPCARTWMHVRIDCAQAPYTKHRRTMIVALFAPPSRPKR